MGGGDRGGMGGGDRGGMGGGDRGGMGGGDRGGMGGGDRGGMGGGDRGGMMGDRGGMGNRGGGPGMMGGFNGMQGGGPQVQPSTSYMTIKPFLKESLDINEDGKDPVLMSVAVDIDAAKETEEIHTQDLGNSEISSFAVSFRAVEPTRLIARASFTFKNEDYAKNLNDIGRTAWATIVAAFLETEFDVKAKAAQPAGQGWGNQGGFNQMGGPQGGFNQMGGPQGGFNQMGGPQGGFNQVGGPQGGFNQAGGPQGGFNQAGGPQGGFNQAGGPQGGFNQAGGPQGGFNQMGGQQGGFNGQRGGGPGGGDGGFKPGAVSTVTPLQLGNTLGFIIDVALDRDTSFKKLTTALHAEMITEKGKAEMIGAKPRIHELGMALKVFTDQKKQFPQGAFPREAGPERAGVPYPPDQRISWMVELLPRLPRGEYVELYDAIDKGKSWRDPENRICATALVAQFLNPYSDKKAWWVPYPGVTRPVAATHFIGVAGVGLDAADYKADDPTVADKLGIFGYDRVTTLDKLKRPENTIAILQVPYEFKTSWMAGGGSTVRGVAEEDAIKPFVCENYQGKKMGTYAVMANGDVRFIPEDIDNEIFKKLCTLNGGAEIENLNEIAPLIPAPKVELKTEPPPKLDDKKPAPGGGGGNAQAMSAAALTKAFVDNSKAAIDKYVGQKVTVQGVVSEVDHGQGVLKLKGHQGDSEVICFFLSNKDAIKGIKPGQTVIVEGECEGRILGESVKLKGSRVQTGSESSRRPVQGPAEGDAKALAVISNRCAQCHTEGRARGKPPMEILTQDGKLKPSAPKERMAEAVSKGRMPPRRGGTPLSAEDKVALETWFNQKK
jgi:hypothetical protein